MERDFKGVFIPQNIWDHPKLSLTDKMVWAIMESVGREDFNVEDTAKRLNTSPEKIVISIDTLFEHRLIKEVRYV